VSRILITGAAGFLGNRTARALVENGHQIHGVVRRIPTLLPNFSIDLHQADALDFQQVEALVEDLRPSHLLLSAWTTVPGIYWNDPLNERWIEASIAAARSFWRCGGQRVVLVGTCAEYDWRDPVVQKRPIKETDAQGEPCTQYGRAKRRAADAISKLAREYGGSFSDARVFFPIGPGEHKDKFLPSIIRSLLAGRECSLGPCDSIRDFIDVRDAGAAIAALIESALEGAVNIGSGTGILLSEVARSVGARLGRPDLIHIGTLANRPDDPGMLVADVNRLCALKNFRLSHPLDRTISDAIEYWSKTARNGDDHNHR